MFLKASANNMHDTYNTLSLKAYLDLRADLPYVPNFDEHQRLVFVGRLLSVHCPHCHAGRGQWCRTPRGNSTRYLHVARHTQARRLHTGLARTVELPAPKVITGSPWRVQTLQESATSLS